MSETESWEARRARLAAELVAAATALAEHSPTAAALVIPLGDGKVVAVGNRVDVCSMLGS